MGTFPLNKKDSGCIDCVRWLYVVNSKRTCNIAFPPFVVCAFFYFEK